MYIIVCLSYSVDHQIASGVLVCVLNSNNFFEGHQSRVFSDFRFSVGNPKKKVLMVDVAVVHS